MFSFLESFDAAVFLLQECAIDHEWDYAAIREAWTKGQSVWSDDNANKVTGVGILVNSAEVEILSFLEIVPGRALLANLKYGEQEIRVLNIYAPTDKHERNDFLNDIQHFIPGPTPLFIAGDFNCILQGEKRQSSAAQRRDKTEKLLQTILTDFNLFDAWANVNKSDPGFTWETQI